MMSIGTTSKVWSWQVFLQDCDYDSLMDGGPGDLGLGIFLLWLDAWKIVVSLVNLTQSASAGLKWDSSNPIDIVHPLKLLRVLAYAL
jgi:hypothetical protein